MKNRGYKTSMRVQEILQLRGSQGTVPVISGI